MLMIVEKCPGCGGEINVDDAPGGLCPVCLLRRGLELANTVDLRGQSTPSVGQNFSPPDPVELEADLPDFDVLALLGQGGMGAVYKARHRGLDRNVAIKILPRQSGADPQLAERFHREARALARLKHEHIVMAFDAGLTGRYSYFVMEYIDGPNLRQLMATGELPPARALAIARDVGEGLRYAHENGIVHRDIKPENVLIDAAGQAKIADFGLAKLRDPRDVDFALTNTRQLMGTLHYMAPEQTESPLSADHRADIYALGVLLYEMLTGELPLGVFDPPSRKRELDPQIDPVVLRALAKDPARRYATAAEFTAAIAALADGSSAGGKRRVPRIVWIASGFAAALVIAVWGWQIWLKYDKDPDGKVSLTIAASGDSQPRGTKPPPTSPSASAGEKRPPVNPAEKAARPQADNPPVHWSDQLAPSIGGAWSTPQPSAIERSYTLSGGADNAVTVRAENGGFSASLIEIAGPRDREAESPTEDLPILLSHPDQLGAYPDKSLTLDYRLLVDRIAKDGHYYMVIDGDHIGHHETPIAGGTFAAHGRIRVARLPEAGNGEPLRIYIEVEKPAFGRSRMRASNVVKTTVQIPDAPLTDILHLKRPLFSPSTTHWEGNALQFETQGTWFEVREIDFVSMNDLMKLAEKLDPKQPHEHFENHLPELLERLLGHKPGAMVSIKFRNLGNKNDETIYDIPFRQ